MIGLVLVTHGALAREFVAAMEHVVGKQAQVAAIPIAPDDDMDARRAEIAAALDANDTGQGAILLTDMFGGTPCNLANSFLGRAGTEVVAGINLPMLIQLARTRDKPLQEAVHAARDAGRKYIMVPSEMLAPAGCG